MRSKGYDWFNAGKMTSFWKNTLKSRDKYGVYVTNSQWMWYENWIPVIEKHCQELQANMDCQTEKVYYPKDVVEEMKKNGYSRFNKWWFNRLWEYELQIDKDNTDYGYYDKYHQFVWKESILPLVLEFCQKNATRLKQKNVSDCKRKRKERIQGVLKSFEKWALRHLFFFPTLDSKS